MTTTDTEEKTTHNSWLHRAWRYWEKVAAFLAIIALVDLTRQLIEWAAWVHWIAEKYAAVRTWLFGWLPFHVPPEWHDPIVLLFVFFSVTNVGVYRRTGHSILSIFSAMWNKTIHLENLVPRSFVQDIIVGGFLGFAAFFTFLAGVWIVASVAPDGVIINVIVFLGALIVLPIFYLIFIVFSAFIYTFVMIAWRWVLTTAAIFGVLVAINEIYMLLPKKLVDG
jgi:hypothetical protein